LVNKSRGVGVPIPESSVPKRLEPIFKSMFLRWLKARTLSLSFRGSFLWVTRNGEPAGVPDSQELRTRPGSQELRTHPGSQELRTHPAPRNGEPARAPRKGETAWIPRNGEPTGFPEN
jgi:hypothetical protein